MCALRMEMSKPVYLEQKKVLNVDANVRIDARYIYAKTV